MPNSDELERENRGPLELLLLEPTLSKSFPLPRSGRLVIGRASECDIVIDDPSVSRRHALLNIGETLSIEDLGSVNGTWLHTTSRDTAPSNTQHGPATTRPGSVGAHAGEPLRLTIGQGFMLGSKLLVLKARSAAAQPARNTGVSERSPILSDPKMQALYATAERIAKSPLSVLILGETGVGKEVLAETIHRLSPRADKPLLRLHCAALSSALLESELFGHEQGAFTGAVRAKVGLLQSAEGGTVFLDEIGELPPDFQVKLLRVLEDRTLTRVGGLKPLRVDVRFIAATHRDLRQEVTRGRFREDLLYRLDGVSLLIPPLRERASEIPELAARFVLEISRSLGLARPPALSRESIASLLEREWPGNVRELKHLIERAVVLCQGDTIMPADLLPSAGSSPPAGAAAPSAPPGAAKALDTEVSALGPLRSEIADLERQRIEQALERAGGNQGRAAELLGISRRTLVSRLSAFGFPRPRRPPS